MCYYFLTSGVSKFSPRGQEICLFLKTYVSNQGLLISRFSPRTFSSGCNDNFAIFAFLAFLLTVLDLIMEMNGMRRRRRDTDRTQILHDETDKNATVATYTLFRGFLNAVAADNDQCQMLFLCESGLETVPYGKTAVKIATLAR